MSSTTGGQPSCPCPPCEEGSNTTGDPVRYGDGEVIHSVTDLEGSAFGLNWGHTRSYGNQLSRNDTGFNGNSWLVEQVQYLLFLSSDLVSVMRGISNSVWVRKEAGQWRGELGARVGLREDGASREIYSQSDGITQVFHGPGAAWYLAGQLKEVISPSGRKATISRDGSGRITKWEATDGAPVPQEALRFDYEYHATGAGAGRLKSVTKVVTRTGSEIKVRRALYGYYGLGSPNGNFKDLASVEIEEWDGAAWVSIRRSCYRYYVPGNPKGFAHGMKYYLGPEAVCRMTAAGVDPASAPDEDVGLTRGVAGFADLYFEYDAQRRVTFERANGNLDFSFAYAASSFTDGFNRWKIRTTHTRPDGSQEVVYSNHMLQVMLKVLKGDGREWYEYTEFDETGRPVQAATSLAVASYSEGQPGLVTLKNNEGLIKTSHYYAATNAATGAAAGFIHYRALKEGKNGSEIRQEEFNYEFREAGGRTIFVPSEQIVYTGVNEAGTAAIDPSITRIGYSWYTNSLQIKQRTTDLPVVPENQHGDGETYSQDEYFEIEGYRTWHCNELGVITRWVYDRKVGKPVQRIDDVQTAGASDVPLGWMTLEGNGKNLVTDFEYDEEGRPVQELGPVHEGVKEDGSLGLLRTARYTVYRDEINEVWTARGYATGTAPGYNYTTLNPVSIKHTNADWQIVDEILARREGTGRLASSDSFPQSSWLAWTHHSYDDHKREAWKRDYFLIPTSEGDAGLNGSNYAQIDFGYDVMNRLNRERSGGGTVSWIVFDVRRLIVSRWVGTNDSGGTDSNPAGEGASSNNMVKVVSNKYDYEGTSQYQPHGNGLLTQGSQHVDETTEHITTYGYDWRNRLTATTIEGYFFESLTYNNVNRVTGVDRKNGNAGGALVATKEASYNSRGRLFRQIFYGIEDGVKTGSFLESNYWYDGATNLIKSQEPGRSAWTKTVFDSLARPVATFVCCPDNGSDDGPSNEVGSDIVVEQTETVYDEASNITGTIRMLRFHDAIGTGPLNGPTGSEPRSRNYYTYRWNDGIGRIVAEANYGTYGGSEPPRPGAIPASSAGILVDLTAYDMAGRVSSNINPLNIENRTEYNALGLVTKYIENWGNDVVAEADRRTTQYSYTLDGLLEVLTLQNPTTGAQITRWQYGATLTESAVASTKLVRSKIFPDSDDAGNPLSSGGDLIYDRVEYSYNRLGQPVGTKDQNETEHVYAYDNRDRLTSDQVVHIGSGVDGAVRRMEFVYDSLDQITLVTSFDAATGGNVVNQIKRKYDAFGKLQEDAQSHAGPVGGSTPTLSYTRGAGVSNSNRINEIVYPNGRAVRLGYGAVDSIDDALSRVVNVSDVSTSSPWGVADYSYIGIDTSVISSYPEPGVELTYIKQGSEGNGSAGDPYAGLDRFGRIIDHRWIKGSADVERLKYGFNQVGLRLWRLDTLAHAANKNQDNHYGYDGLGQVTGRDQGQLADDRSGVDGTPVREEDWIYDASGNWRNYKRRSNGTLVTDQNRTQNRVNEIVTYDVSGIPAVFDAAGNMLRVPRSLSGTSHYEAIWDAWNRLVRVKTPGGAPAGSYSGGAIDLKFAYDGLSRQTIRESVGGPLSVVTHFYYDEQRKCIEERQGTNTSASKQFVFGARGRNDLVFRERFGSEADRLYALCDNMGSKVAVTNTAGTVLERYAFSAFGDLESVMAADYSPRGASLYGWETLFHGEVRDLDTGWYNYGYRWYVPLLGRWPSRDPLGEGSSSNLYEMVGNGPTNNSDFLGLLPPNSNWLPNPGWHPPLLPPNRGNCWRYACNDPAEPTQPDKTHPADPDVTPTEVRYTCEDIMAGAKAKGATDVPASGKCPCGFYKIKGVVADKNVTTKLPDGRNYYDYHWLRENDDGTWSDKPGPGGQVNPRIPDPTADAKKKGYDKDCGDLCVKSPGIDTD